MNHQTKDAPFRKGDRVRMREERIDKRRWRQGTVKSVKFFDYLDGDHDWNVTVLWDGLKTPDSYQMASGLILIGENDMRAELQRGDVRTDQ
jgi:hypothetical protein